MKSHKHVTKDAHLSIHNIVQFDAKLKIQGLEKEKNFGFRTNMTIDEITSA